MKLKGAITELSTDREFGYKFDTTDDFWEKGAEILKVLKPIYIATKEMQKVGYGLADFYISWLRIEKNLNRFSSEEVLLNLTTELEKALKKRANEVLDTPTMLAAIYLDPRVKYKLSNTQKECAMLYIKQLNTRILQVESNEVDDESLDHDENGTSMTNNTLDELNNEFNLASAHDSLDETSIYDPNHVMISFGEYEKVKHIDFKHAVMYFWKNNKDKFPLLYPIARTIHGIPASQCLQESHFSSFSYVRSNKRCSLGAETLQNILMVRLNKQLFYEQKKMDMDNIVKT